MQEKRDANTVRVHKAAAHAALKAKWLVSHENLHEFTFADFVVIHCLDLMGIHTDYGPEVDALFSLECELEDVTGKVNFQAWESRRHLVREYVKDGKVKGDENTARVIRFLNLADQKLKGQKPRSASTYGTRDSFASSLLHPIILKSSWSQYLNGHIRDAVLNAFLAIGDLIRTRSGLTP